MYLDYYHLHQEVNSLNSNDVIIKDKTGKPISLEIIGIFPQELNIIEQFKTLTESKGKQPFLLEGRPLV